MNIFDSARGRWKYILTEAGLPEKYLRNKVQQPCPMCGGKDRYSFTDYDNHGNYFCRKCGAGNGFHLLLDVFKGDKEKAFDFLKQKVGDGMSAHVSKKIDNKLKISYAKEVIAKSKKITEKDGAFLYLKSRGLVSCLDDVPDDLLFCESCEYKFEDDSKKEINALIAIVRNQSGGIIGCHRIYIENGKRANVPVPKKFLGSFVSGCSIRLSQPKNGVLGVAEGLETAMAANALFGIPCVSTINCSNLERYLPPEDVKTLIVFGDNDSSFSGQKSAYTLAFNLTNRIKSNKISVIVNIPDDIDMDYNDVLLGSKKNEENKNELFR